MNFHWMDSDWNRVLSESSLLKPLRRLLESLRVVAWSDSTVVGVPLLDVNLRNALMNADGSNESVTSI